MPSHRWHVRAGSGRLLVAMAGVALLSPSAAVASRSVPDDPALIQYVDALPSAEGPVVASPAEPRRAPARLTGTAAPGPAALESQTAAALRRLPGAANPGPATASPPTRRPTRAQPSAGSALGAAVTTAKTPSIVLAVLLAAALGAAAARRGRAADRGDR